MEDTSSLGGRSSSADVVSNVSMVTTPDSDVSSRDGGEVVSPARLEQQVQGSEHELRGLGQQGNAECSFSELSMGTTAQDEIGAIQKETGVTQDVTGKTEQNETGVSKDELGLTKDKARAPQDETGVPQEETEATPQNEIGIALEKIGTATDESGATQDETGATQEVKEAALQYEAGVAQYEFGTTNGEVGAVQDETIATQEETTVAPQKEIGVALEKMGTTTDEAWTTQDETGATQEETEAAPQVESDDNIKIKSVSSDFKIEDRPQSQQSLTGTDRRSVQQEKLPHDVLSANQSPAERLSTSRQTQCEDVTSIRSEDGSSLNTTDSQYDSRSGNPAGRCCEQTGELVKEEPDAESGNVEVVVRSVVLETAQSPVSLEPRDQSRLSCQNEPNLDKVGYAQLNHEELGGAENTILVQEAAQDVLRVQSPEEASQLKAEITSLQTRLQTLTKDNSEKGMRIVALESNILEMTAKLLNAEKKCLPLEVSPGKRETSKSRTCAIL